MGASVRVLQIENSQPRVSFLKNYIAFYTVTIQDQEWVNIILKMVRINVLLLVILAPRTKKDSSTLSEERKKNIFLFSSSALSTKGFKNT